MKSEDSRTSCKTTTETQITETEILKMFSLSKLAPPADGLTKFIDEFNSILNFFSSLNEVDTTDVDELAQVHDIMNVFRPDEISPPLAAEVALKNAPEQYDRCFKVPLVVET
jgi:aspartyl-tRNA(Asn)/glutamyl-tRNA(Gln) amidotransferase subunit C